MQLGDFNPLKELVGLAGKAIDAKAASYRTAPFGGNGEQAYGVDEYGRVYQRGTPSAPGSVDPRMLLLGAGLVAVVLVVFLAKN